MDAIRIRGSRALSGTIRVSGAKNAALPILCATLLSDGESRLRNVPALRDIETTAALLRYLGRPVDVAMPEVRVKAPIGKVKFTADQLADNLSAFMDTIVRAKPAAAKGIYIRSATVSSTMGPGVPLDTAVYR